MIKPPIIPEVSKAAGHRSDALRLPSRVWRAVKILWLAGWLSLATLAVFPPITLVSLFSRSGNAMFNLARLWAWVILGVTRTRVFVRGLEKVDRSRSFMIIANHQSHFDGPALALGLGGVQFRWIAKKELLKIPLFGHCLESSRNIFIDRSDREKAVASIQAGIRRLPQGVSIMCFAEGTRSASGQIGTFKKGGFMAAVQGALPILPVAVCGSRDVLPKGSAVFQQGSITLIVGDPIETKGVDAQGVDALIGKTRRAILSLCQSAQDTP